MRVLKICIGTWVNASHDKRELSAVRELGAETEVVAKGDVSGTVEKVDGFRVTRLSARPLGDRFPVSLNRVASIFTWAAYVRKMNVDIITGHDLSGLVIGYLSNFCKRKKAKLVYDSHEFELGRSADRSKALLLLLKHAEKFLMKRCVFSLVVCDSIADELQRLYRLKDRPIVARNTPFYWELDDEKIRKTRHEILASMNLPDSTFIVMFHGYFREGEGIESILHAVANIPGTAAVLVGNSSPDRKRELQNMCSELNIQDRTYFHAAVPVEELPRYVGSADVGVAMLLPVNQNNIWALPNKFFENVQSLTPVIVSDFPEIGKMVDRYQIGLKVDPENESELVSAIERMRDDSTFYEKCKENLKQAKEELCWEKEKKVLQRAYQEILK